MKRTMMMGAMIALMGSVAHAGLKVTEDVPPVLPSPTAVDGTWTIEASVANVFAMRSLLDAHSKKLNLAGPELTGVYHLDQHQSITLRGSALFGRRGNCYDGGGLGKLDVMLMPGYRYTWGLTPTTDVYVGANLGVMYTDVNKRHSYKLNGGGSESAYGVAASAEMGVRFAITEDLQLFAALQLSADMAATPTVDDLEQRNQVYTGVRIGLSYDF